MMRIVSPLSRAFINAYIKNMERYDIAIIGTGPAGLSAALTAKIRNKNFVLLGSKRLSEKIEKAHTVQNYLGLPNITGSDMQKAFYAHLEAMDIGITEARVQAVYPMGAYFGLQTSIGMLEAEALILATGVVAAKPYPGEERFLGKGVSYCATCDAPLYKNKTAVVIAFGANEESEANFLADVAAKVYYIPMYKGDVRVSDKIEIVREVPKSIEGDTYVQALVSDAGKIRTDGVFILREAISPSRLVSGIEVDNNHVRVNRRMETSVAGCFACGDLVGAPYQYSKAAGEGTTAALAAVSWLDAKKRGA